MTPLKLLVLGAALALSGCALLGKSDPVVPRYFTLLEAPASPSNPPPGKLRLHLGRIEGLSHMREPMAWRISPEEIRYSEDRRWTERPEVYLRQALSSALFQQRGVVEVLSGRALVLDVELTEFEAFDKPENKVRVQASYLVRDERLALLQETVTVDQPVVEAKGSSREQEVVEAYSTALRAAVAQIADHVVAKLNESAAASP